MKVITGILLLMLVTTVSAQTGQSFVGQWKVIIMSGPEMHLDFSRDSVALDRKLESKQDSALLKEVSIQMLSSIGTIEFIFHKDSTIVYTTRFDEEKGSFSVNEKDRRISMVFQRNGKPVKEIYLFEFTGARLKLKNTDEESEIFMVLERQQ